MSQALIFGKVPHPPFTDRLVLDVENYAWDYLGQRRPIGICQHSMIGTLWGTDAWFRRGYASNGLTDYGIGGATDGPQWDGVIFRWNDPLGRAFPGVSPNRSPWANGGSDGLEGDGVAFYQKFGANGINRYLVSIERSDGGNINTPPSAKYLASFTKLAAYWADQAKIPWDQYPYNSTEGVAGYYWHKEFATKDCPFPPVTSAVDATQKDVIAILKSYQLQQAPPPEPTPPPPPDDSKLLPLPAGMSWELVARNYGQFKSQWGTVYKWDEGRAPCQVWYNTGVRSIPPGKPYTDGVFPPLVNVIRRGDQTRCQFQWSNGMLYEAGC
jgi:hypothetical protein